MYVATADHVQVRARRSDRALTATKIYEPDMRSAETCCETDARSAVPCQATPGSRSAERRRAIRSHNTILSVLHHCRVWMPHPLGHGAIRSR